MIMYVCHGNIAMLLVIFYPDAFYPLQELTM
jgi:hypothetical protein